MGEAARPREPEGPVAVRDEGVGGKVVEPAGGLVHGV